MPVPRWNCAAKAVVASAMPNPARMIARRRASAITLLRPGVAVVVVAARFPEAGTVGGDDLDAPDPFGAFPEIEPRHDRAHRTAMLPRQRTPLPGTGEQHVSSVEFHQREVGRVVVIAVKDDEARGSRRADRSQDMSGADALPHIVEARPCGDAVNVGHIAERRLGEERAPVPDHRHLDQAVDRELPALGSHLRLDAEIEHRPVLDSVLARRQALLGRTRRPAGKETAFASPALLALDELPLDCGERLVLIL